MSELSKCPVCGRKSRMAFDDTFVACSDNNCYVTGPRGDPTGEKWNLMCEHVRIGKEALALVPDDFRFVRVNGEWFVGGLGEASCDNRDFGASVYIVIEPITQPPTKESVLTRLGDYLLVASRSGLPIEPKEAASLMEQIDAVLERGGK